ncbi:MAG: hypothetical protein K8I82_10705 [Anaerolineae bacterium]|nr:hypothetical protein [Anaerolineae bacterium]
MTLTHILIFIALALVYRLVVPARGRGWALMAASVVIIYWLQPALPIRRLDFLLPTLTLLLTVLVWFVTKGNGFSRRDFATLGLITALVIALSLTRYLIPELRPTPSRPPALTTVLPALVGMGILLGMVAVRRWKLLVLLSQLLIILIFVALKYEPLTEALSAALRRQMNQDTELASVLDIQWLGFSYVAFRLLHLLRDHQTGKLDPVSLREHVTYVIFFPAFTAGPIDRIERFVQDDRALNSLFRFSPVLLVEGGARIAVGVFKKFVVADTLALISLNPTNAEQADSTLALWLFLYVYSFRLYFDFSGYSDIAIGLGYLLGIRLPENFDRPYLKENITAFWQSWHMTLSNWARFYVFSPLSRGMLRWKIRPSTTVIVLIAHLSTMLVIGLWHGITLNFVLWGLWHGIGLFMHKLWSDRTRRTYRQMMQNPRQKVVWNLAGWLLTFHFVTLGWVWFSLPDFETAATVFLKLFGGS